MARYRNKLTGVVVDIPADLAEQIGSLDEAQILTEKAMEDMVPATNAAPNGLVLMMGTPPHRIPKRRHLYPRKSRCRKIRGCNAQTMDNSS